MSTIRCDIVSAEKEIFHGNVSMVIATGEMGELGIAPRHAPLITRLKPGQVRLPTDAVKDPSEAETFLLGQAYHPEPAVAPGKPAAPAAAKKVPGKEDGYVY